MPTAPPKTALAARISNALNDSPYLSTRDVRIEANAGHVRLQGSVGTFFQKQMAQEALRRVDGIEALENLLEVRWS